MRVITYVEGSSDKQALEALLRPLIEKKIREGVDIQFFEAPPGDKKVSVLRTVPRRAVGILRGDPHATVVALPDLYPPNKAFPHRTFDELRDGIEQNFRDEMERLNVTDERLPGRFHVFCLKHDLEVLLLAAKDVLAHDLDISELRVSWTTPVEDQNHDRPPKRVVEGLFRSHGRTYRETVDAPRILERADPDTIAERCPQCFGPYVEFLDALPPR